MTEISSQKQKPWQFQKGRSGNPAGKPNGTRSAITLAAEVQLDGEAEGPTRKCINLAMKGDAVALCPCMERVAPPRKFRRVVLDIPQSPNPRI
jgi:hypothetical protein